MVSLIIIDNVKFIVNEYRNTPWSNRHQMEGFQLRIPPLNFFCIPIEMFWVF